jgi:hypothetical protein
VQRRIYALAERITFIKKSIELGFGDVDFDHIDFDHIFLVEIRFLMVDGLFAHSVIELVEFHCDCVHIFGGGSEFVHSVCLVNKNTIAENL